MHGQGGKDLSQQTLNWLIVVLAEGVLHQGLCVQEWAPKVQAGLYLQKYAHAFRMKMTAILVILLRPLQLQYAAPGHSLLRKQAVTNKKQWDKVCEVAEVQVHNN